MAASADEYMKQAEKKATAFFFKDLDGAYDLYIKAAGVYKADKDWRGSGNAFMKAGDTAMALKNPGDACSAYTDCAKCLKRVDMKGAKAAMEQACKLNIENNRLPAAARLLKEWAEALEQDEQWDEAIDAYKRARGFFNAEDQPQAANGCLLKMAGILASADRFDEAAKAYEDLGFKYAEGPLKHQAKEQFFRSFICRLATITPDNSMEKGAEARDALDVYLGTDSYFRNTREAEACEMLLQAVEDSDEGKFDEVIGNLNELRMLDDMKSHCLLKVKASLTDVR
mmetsp:Transcript_26570/g.82129  ORF Transcript_26570/g.82129 Transcript_26570/m.82129 type:complete len:284 (-) Transcript_26570:138-989(-)|eukprot:CAMPEP_0174827762 /NCGR_PEP_ID=MMETSP1114-20130205/917_1 /TAXON_ID=312471 /ORGANISM="Neobodo designis, Strain CCAP 1951/1" /LENGTH=283 /DNA_ID=CAMNT_0016061439 /DNA_START=98 /DNA_END=949 /DNA_ORIENTATION=+